MSSAKKGNNTPVLSIITIILGILVVIIFLLFGVANLIHPDVPESYLDQNTRVCIGIIIASIIILYAIYRPYPGGILLCIYAIAYFFIVHNPLVYPIILLGVLSIIRGLREKRKSLEENIQTS